LTTVSALRMPPSNMLARSFCRLRKRESRLSLIPRRRLLPPIEVCHWQQPGSRCSTFEGGGVILLGRIDDFTGPTGASALCETLNSAQQRGRSDRRLDLSKAGRRRRPYKVACQYDFESRSHADPLNCRDRRKWQFFEISDRSDMASEALARFLRGPSFEDRDVGAGGEMLAVALHQLSPKRMFFGLIDGQSQVLYQFLVE
jgi:hypothetical protein